MKDWLLVIYGNDDERIINDIVTYKSKTDVIDYFNDTYAECCRIINIIEL